MNAKIRVILSTVLVISVAFTSVVFHSCKKKPIKYNDTTLTRPCEKVVCYNGGTCKDGLCICSTGFEGSQCKTPWNEKFVGMYKANDQCNVGTLTNVNITPIPNKADGILIHNLGIFCPDASLTANITPEKTVFNIPMQKSCGDYYVSGIGNIKDSYIHLSLIARDTINHTSEQCSILLTK